MTKERLLEAIKSNNPETGLKDLIAAARTTIEYCNDRGVSKVPSESKRFDMLLCGRSSYCVLAQAWRDGHDYVYIGSASANLGGIFKIHSYQDVVRWFDNFGINDLGAAEEVLQILGESYND